MRKLTLKNRTQKERENVAALISEFVRQGITFGAYEKDGEIIIEFTGGF